MESTDKKHDFDDSFNECVELSEHPEHPDSELNINTRSRSVYEQYLKKTMQDMVHEPEYCSENPPSKTADCDTYTYHPNITAIEAESEQTTTFPPILNKTQSSVASTTKSSTTKQPIGKSHSNVKLVILTAVSSAVIIAVTVVMLDMNGSLVSAFDRVTSLSKQTSMTSANAPVVEAEPMVKTQENKHGNKKEIDKQSIKPNTAVKNESASTEPAITYEDFREEAKNTLYRDSKE